MHSQQRSVCVIEENEESFLTGKAGHWIINKQDIHIYGTKYGLGVLKKSWVLMKESFKLAGYLMHRYMTVSFNYAVFLAPRVFCNIPVVLLLLN